MSDDGEDNVDDVYASTDAKFDDFAKRDGRTDGRTDGPTDGRTDRRMDRHTGLLGCDGRIQKWQRDIPPIRHKFSKSLV